MSYIRFENVSKSFNKNLVIDSADFCIEKGDFAAISGPSGSGKSTLLNMIGLIDLPTSGSIILDGTNIYDGMDLSKMKKLTAAVDSKLTNLRRKNIGFIFQTFNLVPVLNVRENVQLPLTLGPTNATSTMSSKEVDE